MSAPTSRTAAAVGRYVGAALQRPWIFLGFYAVLTVLAGWAGSAIRIDAELKSLLPEDAPSVVAIEEARQRRGGSDLFVIAVESPEPMATVRFVEALAERFAEWEEVEYLDYERDQTFFRSHALLYLPVDELAQIKDNIQRIIRRELGRNHPLFEDLETPTDADEEDFAWRDLDRWISPYTLAELGISEDEAGSLFPFLRGTSEGSGSGAETADDDETDGAEDDDNADDTDDTDDTDETDETAEERRIRQARWDLPDAYQDYRIATHGRVAVFAAKLRGRSTDLDYAELVYRYGEEAIAELDPSTFHPELRAHVAGAYAGFLEVDSVKRDATRATQISIGMILLLLIVFFRNLRSVYVVLVPLLVGVTWTLGLLELIYGHLNILTVFVFSMLIGMGIDFGIHIYRRAQEEVAGGESWESGLTESLTKTGRALLTATATTVVSLLTLQLASFDGFREFGVACGLGVAVCLLATCLLIPPLVGASERLWPTKVSASAAKGGRGIPLAWIRVAAVAVVALAVVGVYETTHIEFEYNFRNLEAPPDPDRIPYGSALGRNRSSAPAIILGRDDAQMRQVHGALRERLRADDPLLRGFTTIESIVPSEQEERMAMIDEIYAVLDRRAVQNIDGDEGELIAELTELTDVEPFGLDDLPRWSRQQIEERDGSVGSMGLLYGDYNGRDARDVQRFQEVYDDIELPGGERVAISSNGFILADVVRYVQADGFNIAIYVTLGLLIVLFIDLRSVVGVVVCVSTLAAAVLLTCLGMVIFDIKLGLYNIVVLPTVLGVGIDGAVHLYHRYREEGVQKLGVAVRTTGAAIAASSITTAAGFVGLLLIPHKGIRTIGALTVLGVLCTLVAVLTVLPAGLSLFGKAKGDSTD